ncbi:hypothetical protein GRI42_00695 [Erythrobacter gaetbuli]|uniref:Autotransporter outer membrane beta-barrel domain-containing protein n=1 Tax=Qipengyuania gaetbuli TaxID=266952 RepID=A0A844XW61_9SPHN|nr:hypothetical protein [Qipengyuania gaetbuli]MXO49816.1 hypothetical protein [Qipengyuania gaetbuli]
MISAGVERRGRPLVFLLVVLGGWTMLRMATWENPFPHQFVPQWAAPVVERFVQQEAPARATSELAARAVQARHTATKFAMRDPHGSDLDAASDIAAHPAPFAEGRTLAGHNLLFMAAMARIPMPSSIADVLGRDDMAGTVSPVSAGSEEVPQRRWRFDGWLLLRGVSAGEVGTGPALSSYGGSQAGALLAYSLAPGSRRDPAFYLRASAALREPGQSEAALGVRVRPLGDRRLALHAEVRGAQTGSGTQVRPAAFATYGYENRNLPHRLGARAYAQAGYVGSDFATGFADGQLVLDREVAKFDLATLRVGAGAWGGIQKGAGRIDVGPSAGLEMEIGDVPARIGLDYRIRIAGDAEPGDGPALTLSTGF